TVYRDVAENVTGAHPHVYRQVHAGAELGVIVAPRQWPVPDDYRAQLEGVPFVRRVLMYPPLILDPPANTRGGSFVEVHDNPLAGVRLEPGRWLCYPAVVGHLTVFVFVEQRFLGLGLSLANLFELASDEQIAAGPDAVYVYGAPPDALVRFGEPPTVFFDDTPHELLVGAVPLDDRFAYFGYLKKMVLTLHNVVAMKRGHMPFHGAYTRLVLHGGRAFDVLLVGDTATGKSETLEALRLSGDELVAEQRIVADDMGTLQVVDADGRPRVLGFGSEIGAFVRLDDLQQGYAIGQIDRAIIMSPQKVNARVVLPVTTLDEVLRGYPVDVLLYANNYEPVDEDHPIIERFTDAGAALAVFREGRAMSKGTTTSSGLVANYFANVFGPAQRPAQHDVLAERTFAAAFAAGTFVGQLRTRLALPGFETDGPRAAAAALLELITDPTTGEAGT
ncbi:MAG TPA: phosphoenolpyruvate carboxykinase, partial [Thermoleophilia bacterium]|nr:phosphoenolpyruvate carboxykinase [Thermoleophilia bacterium]